MFAFGSLMFSAFLAFGQFGGALFLGVAACFLTTAIILPGILGLIEKKQRVQEMSKLHNFGAPWCQRHQVYPQRH
jgi:predicted RND superfamily exporter protein